MRGSGEKETRSVWLEQKDLVSSKWQGPENVNDKGNGPREKGVIGVQSER